MTTGIAAHADASDISDLIVQLNVSDDFLSAILAISLTGCQQFPAYTAPITPQLSKTPRFSSGNRARRTYTFGMSLAADFLDNCDSRFRLLVAIRGGAEMTSP